MESKKEQDLTGLARLLLSYNAQDMMDNKLTEKVVTIKKGTHDGINVQVRIVEENDKILSIEFKLVEAMSESKDSRNVPEGYH